MDRLDGLLSHAPGVRPRRRSDTWDRHRSRMRHRREGISHELLSNEGLIGLQEARENEGHRLLMTFPRAVFLKNLRCA